VGLFAVLIAIALVIVWRLHGTNAREVAPITHTAPAPIDPRITLKTSILGGRVTRANDGTAIAAAFVSVTTDPVTSPVIVRTNEEGSWMTAVAAGTYHVAVNAPGFFPKSVDSIVIAYGESSTVPVALDAGGSVVRGTISDVGGGPIIGATVSIGVSGVTTNSEGRYAIAVADGVRHVDVAHEDYCPESGVVAVNGADATLDLRLVPGASIRGDVIARDTHLPIPAATISSCADYYCEGRDTADSDGHFVVHQLHSGRQYVSARAPGYVSRGEEAVEVGLGETAGPVHLILDPAFSISGLVMENGHPAANALVRVYTYGPRALDVTARTAADGTYSLDGLSPGRYAIQIYQNDRLKLEGAPIEVRDRDVTDQLYAIPRGVSVRGRVEPAGKVGLSLMSEQRGIAIAASGLHDDGSFTIEDLVPGSYKLEATTIDHHHGELAFDVHDSGVDNLVVKLDTSPRVSVSGRVVDEDGAAVASAMVSVDGELATTDAAGRFAVTGLAPGKRMITASWDSPMFGANLRYVDAPSDNNTLTIESRHSSIKGRVFRADHQPAADTWVTATRIEAPDESVSITSALTAADGTFSISPLSKGVYSITARDTRLGAKAELARVHAGESVSIALEALSTLGGRVTANGKPVEQYDLRCGYGDLQQRIAASDGAYHFDHVRPGLYTCKATTRDGSAEAAITVGTEPATLDLELHAYGSVTGTLVNAFTGKPVAGLLVFTDTVPDSSLARGPAISDADGHFVVERARSGEGFIAVSSSSDRSNRNQAIVRYEMADGESVDVGEIRALPARHGRAGTLGMKTQNLEVVELAPGGPAELAGIHKGDDISAIEGVSTGTLSRQVLGALLFDDVVTAGDTYHFELGRGVTVAVTAN
jgi:hypothetical protein